MAKKDIPMVMFEPMSYEGRVNENYLRQAKQSSAFLNDVGEISGMMKEMMVADLKATAKFAQYNINGAVANCIRDEARRLVGDAVSEWY